MRSRKLFFPCKVHEVDQGGKITREEKYMRSAWIFGNKREAYVGSKPCQTVDRQRLFRDQCTRESAGQRAWCVIRECNLEICHRYIRYRFIIGSTQIAIDLDIFATQHTDRRP